VTLLVRGEGLEKSMSSYLVQAIQSTANVNVRTCTEVVDGRGEESLESITLADRAAETVEEVPASALFIMIGGEPHTEWLPGEMVRDSHGYLVTGRQLFDSPDSAWECGREPLTLETSIPGVFTAGDVRQGSFKRVAAAVGEGATVVRLVHEHLEDQDRRAALPVAPV